MDGFCGGWQGFVCGSIKRKLNSSVEVRLEDVEIKLKDVESRLKDVKTRLKDFDVFKLKKGIEYCLKGNLRVFKW